MWREFPAHYSCWLTITLDTEEKLCFFLSPVSCCQEGEWLFFFFFFLCFVYSRELWVISSVQSQPIWCAIANHFSRLANREKSCLMIGWLLTNQVFPYKFYSVFMKVALEKDVRNVTRSPPFCRWVFTIVSLNPSSVGTQPIPHLFQQAWGHVENRVFTGEVCI